MSQLLQSGAATAPIILALALLALRVPSLHAGLAGLAGSLAVASTVFRPESDEVHTAVTQLGPMVLEVALILLGGVALSVALATTGARDHIAGWLERTGSAEERLPAILLLVYGLTPFMESVTGFGLGVVITAPLLVRLGLSPVKAVVAGLLGLVLVPWGSLGPGTLVAAQLGGQDFAELGLWSALLTLPVLAVSMTALLVVVGIRPGTHPGTHPSALPVARVVASCAALVALQWGALVAANALVGTPPAGLIASAVVIAALLGVSRLRHGPLPPPTRELGRALAPFAVLLPGILGATLVVHVTGSPWVQGWLDSPALWVNIAALVALRAAGTSRAGALRVARQTVTTWVPVAATAVVFMLIGIVMATAGMAAHLAELAAGLGGVSLMLIPATGALGGYLTGSNTGAAAMFSAASADLTAGLGADTLIALAGQNVAGSFAIIASPPRIALAVGVVMAGATRLPRRATRLLAAAVVASATLLGAAVAVLA